MKIKNYKRPRNPWQMTLRNLSNVTSIIAMLLFLSCTSAKKLKSKIDAYSTSTLDIEKHFVALPIVLGKLEYSGPVIIKDYGYIVITGDDLYKKLYDKKYTFEAFSNFIFAKLVRGEKIYLSSDECELLKNDILPKEMAEKYLQMNTNRILRKNFTGQVLFPSNYPENKLTLEGKGILVNLLHNGVVVEIDDESGYFMYKKLR